MSELLFSNGAAWFTIPAIFGTGVFVIRLALMLMGAAHIDIGVDTASGGDMASDGAGHGGADHDSTYAFEVLSFQSICTFLMGFGWGGLASLRGSNLGWPLSIAIALACGAAMVWVLALLLRGMHELESSGNLNADAALGSEGQVYVGVPAAGAGRGQVRVVIGDNDRIYDAVSDGGELPSRTRVRVVRINSDNSVTVAPV